MNSKTMWYKISANEIAKKLTFSELNLKKKPEEKNPKYFEYLKVFKKNLAKARGIKYGVISYSQMYMKERELILGEWKEFLLKFCCQEGINIAGRVLVTGINDGQEVSFLESEVLTGVDVSGEAVSRGKKMFPQINFICQDLCKFRPENESFDSYLALRTIHFFEDSEIKRILENAWISLTSGGKIVVSVPGGFMTEEGKIVFGQLGSGEIVDVDKPRKDAQRIALFIENANFSNVKIINHKIEIFVIGTKV